MRDMIERGTVNKIKRNTNNVNVFLQVQGYDFDNSLEKGGFKR